MNVTFEFLRLVVYFGVLICCGTACTYTEVPLKRAPDSDWLRADFTANTIELCKDACTADSGCKGADFNNVNSFCYLLTAAQTPPYIDDNDYTHLVKNCGSPPASCTMTTTNDTKAQPTTKVQLSLTSADHCSSACLHLAECLGVRYSAGECKIYTGTAPSASNTGDTLTHVKQSCTGTTSCCMVATAVLKASDDAVMTLTSSVDSCETVCLTTSDCHAVYFKNDVCYAYSSLPATESQVGATFSEKSCTGSATGDVTFTEECYGATATIPSQSLFFVVLVPILTMCFR